MQYSVYDNFSSQFRRFSTTSVELATVSVFSETAQQPRRNKASRLGGFKPSFNQQQQSQQQQNDGFTRRTYKPKVQATAVDHDAASTSLYKFKLNRTPGRWQYKTTAKPRITIRKQNGELETTIQSSTPSLDAGQFNDIISNKNDDNDLESSSSINGDVLNDEETIDNGIENVNKYPVETLKVEISTPADFKDTYYEIATIKSPYTFQVCMKGLIECVLIAEFTVLRNSKW